MSRLDQLRASPFHGVEIGAAALTPEFLPASNKWLADDFHFTTEERHGQILCSAIVHGALLDRNAWQDWFDALPRFHSCGELAWVSYKVECHASPTGYKNRQWFADPVTRRLWHRRLNWVSPVPAKSAEECLLAFLKFVNPHEHLDPDVVNRLAAWAELHWRLRIPALLIDQALGNCQTNALSETSFLRLANGIAAAERIEPSQKRYAAEPLPPGEFEASKDWFARFREKQTPEGKAFDHVRQIRYRNEYSQRRLKALCASWLNQSKKSLSGQPARQLIVDWCVAQLRFRRPYGPQGFAPYTVQSRLVTLMEGFFDGEHPVTLADISDANLMARARTSQSKEKCPTRRQLIWSAATDFAHFSKSKAAWEESKRSFKASTTGLGSAAGGPALKEAVQAEIISAGEYLRCLRYALKMDRSGELALMIILGFRAGLRMTEVVGLETSDFVSSDKHLELHVQKNHFRELKTPNSRRILPLDVLLPPSELQILKDWLEPRSEHAGKTGRPILCFGPLGGRIMPSDRYSTDRIDRILKAITGQDLTYHCLRHSFSSYLMLNLLLPGPESELLIPRSFRSCVTWGRKPISHKRLIGAGALGQSAMHAVSMLMGHTGIPRTLKSYQHLLDLAVSLYCWRSAVQMPLDSYLREHLDEDVEAPRRPYPTLVEPKFIRRALREMGELHPSSGDDLPLVSASLFEERPANWWKSGFRQPTSAPCAEHPSGRSPPRNVNSKPLTPAKSAPVNPESVGSAHWKMIHELVTSTNKAAEALALKAGIPVAILHRWQRSHQHLFGKAPRPNRATKLYGPRGPIAEKIVETMWWKRGEIQTAEKDLLREFLDGFRLTSAACRFSSEHRAKEFAGLLRRLGVPGEHIGIAYGSKEDLRECQKIAEKMMLVRDGNNGPVLFRESKERPARRRQSPKLPALWISYIKLSEDELGWSFSRQHRLDALQELRDEEIEQSGGKLTPRRVAAKAKRAIREAKHAELGKDGKRTYQAGSGAYLFGLQILAISHGITVGDTINRQV